MIGKQFIALALVGIAVFLSTGLLLVFIACHVDDSWLLLLVVLSHASALIFPAMCDGYNFEGMPTFMQDNSSNVLFNMRALGWFMLGLLFLSGYALPLVMYRGGSFTSAKPVYLAIAGGTLIWIAIILFMAAFLCNRKHTTADAYGPL